VCIYIVGIISFFEYDVDSYEEFYYKVENMMALRVLRIYDKKRCGCRGAATSSGDGRGSLLCLLCEVLCVGKVFGFNHKIMINV
jgi:hypothetical protein